MVEGVAAVHRRLAKLVPEAIENRVRQALGDAAEQVCDDMRALAPKGDTMRLVNSIGWTFGRAPKGAITLASANADLAADRGVRVTIFAGGGPAFYARFLEFGTRKMRARPFFFPAYRANKRRVKGAITRALNKAIKENSK